MGSEITTTDKAKIKFERPLARRDNISTFSCGFNGAIGDRYQSSQPVLLPSELPCKKFSDPSKPCVFGEVADPSYRIMLMGDRHAKHLVSGLNLLGKRQKIRFEFSGFTTNPPIWWAEIDYGESIKKAGYQQHQSKLQKENKCRKIRNQWLQTIHDSSYDVVMFASRWATFVESEYYGAYGKLLLPLRRNFFLEPGNPAPTLEASKMVLTKYLQLTIEDVLNRPRAKLFSFLKFPHPDMIIA